MADLADDLPEIETSLGYATLERVQVMGLDLCEDVIGHMDFASFVFLLLCGRRPAAQEARMVNALLVALMDHGFTGSAVATRLVYHMAPEAVQGAVAAGLLAAGSRHLGTAEHAARMLQEAVAAAPEASPEDLAREVVGGLLQRRQLIPGVGHGTHAAGDPRAARLMAVARETGTHRAHCRLMEGVQREAEARLGRRLPLNVTGAMGAVVSDLGMPWQLGKAFALIGRTAGLLAHLREEVAHPAVPALTRAMMAQVRYVPPASQEAEGPAAGGA